MGGVQSTVSNIENLLGINQNIPEAARKNEVAKIKQLLEAGADINEVDSEGHNGLHIACAEGNIESVKFLLEQKNIQLKGRRGFTPYHRAVQYNQVQVLGYLLENNIQLLNATNDIGVTPLHWSAVWGSIDCLKLLLEKGAHINSRQSNGQTALHCAVLHSQIECISELLNKGCDVIIKDNEGKTAKEITTEKEILAIFAAKESESNRTP